MTHKPFSAIAIFAIIALFLGIQVFAQQVIDKAQYRFYYEYAWEFDTLTYNDTREDLIILQVGQNVSKCFSYYTFKSDSLRATPDGRDVFREALRKTIEEWRSTGNRPQMPYSRRMGAKVYKNYPHRQVTVTDNISTHYYKYTDELHSQTWQITDSTKTILDYPCQMAISDFRGRRWIAWFANDIPISDGPWKFSGLPGLITEVYDSENHFHFTLVGIEQVEDEPIVFSPVVLESGSLGKHEEATRIEFIRGLARFRGNSSSMMNAELGRETFDETSNSSRPNDLIERDY